MRDDVPIASDESLQQTANEYINERNSLRRFLAGLTATTFGVLVALHPHTFTPTCGRYWYMASVLLNAISVLSFIVSIFGRYRGLYAEGSELVKQNAATLSGGEYSQSTYKDAKLYAICTKIGLYTYILAIISACVYIVLDICV